MTENSFQSSQILPVDDLAVTLTLGVSAALVAAAFVLFHWTVGLVAAAVVLALAATANEWFLLGIIFLGPLAWTLGGASSLVSGLPAFSTIDAMQVLRWLTIGAFFLGLLWRGELQLARLVRSRFARPSLAFAGAVFLSCALGTPGMRFTSFARAGTHLIVFLGFFFLILAWANTRRRFEGVTWILFLTVIATSCLGILQMLIGGYTPLRHLMYAGSPGLPPWSGRASSVFATVDELAVYLCLLLPFALGCFAFTRGRWKRIGGWAFALGTIGLVCTQSHGAFLGLFAVLGVAVFLLARTWKARLLTLAAACLLAAGIYAVVHVVGLSHASKLQETSLVGRLLLWSAAWKFFVSSPIHGIGWENFQILHMSQFSVHSIAGIQVGVESLYFQLLAETGLLGFVTFFVLLFLAFRAALDGLRSAVYPLRRALAFGVLGAVVVMLVQGITEAQLEVPQLGTVFWMLLALLVVSERVETPPESQIMRREGPQSSSRYPEFPVAGETAEA